jgi:ribonuclease HI
MERNRSEKYIGNCCDSQAALKVLQAAKTTYPLEKLCRRALNDLSAHRSVRLIWFLRRSGESGNKITDKRAREVSAH